MTRFEKVDFGTQGVQFAITDDFSHTALLIPHQAYELLQWLDEQRDELSKLTHQQHEQQSKQRRGIDAEELPEQVHEDWANDE